MATDDDDGYEDEDDDNDEDVDQLSMLMMMMFVFSYFQGRRGGKSDVTDSMDTGCAAPWKVTQTRPILTRAVQHRGQWRSHRSLKATFWSVLPGLRPC